MKNRSHRLPMTEPRHDDWVDGSWTVDCICGVTDDDGEEMVNCDECGVWVHTRCSRYVKSDKSFACDKCKSKNNGGDAATGGGGSSGRNDSEETEVAEFLLELPTKTLRMENPIPATVSSHRPFRLWANIPMEEKVHAQGFPGGEPALFSGIGMSSVFGPQLWKCSGYVPKKFNFRYTEFPCLDNVEVEEKEEGRVDKGVVEEISNRADDEAGVLISFLKKNANCFPTPEEDSVGVKSPVEAEKEGTVNAHSKSPEESQKKESSSVPVLLHPGKLKKHGFEMKDKHVKKKARTIEKEKKQAAYSPKAASTFSSDGKRVKISQDRGSKAANNGIQCDKDRLMDGLGECATNLASNEHGTEATLRNNISSDEISRGVNVRDEVNVSKTSNCLEGLVEISGAQSKPVNRKDAIDGLQRCVGQAGTVETGLCETKLVAVDVRISGENAKQSEHCLDSDIDEANSQPKKKLKVDLHADCHAAHDVKLDSTKATGQCPKSIVTSKEVKVVEMSTISLEANERKILDASKCLTAGGSRIDKSDGLGGNACKSNRESPGSEVSLGPRKIPGSESSLGPRKIPGSEGSLGTRKRSPGLKHSSEKTEELLKPSCVARINSAASYQNKVAISALKSSSSSGCIASKSSENFMATTVQSHSRHKELSDVSSVTVKDNSSANKVEHETKSGRLKKLVKEPLRSSSLPKISESSRFSNMSDSKGQSSDSKESIAQSSAKTTSVPNVASNRILGECGSASTIEGASNVENKASCSAGPGKGEKFRGHLTSNAAPTSSNVPATLTDEELALLLHQELNSSPRVLRVPRMRNAGSLPHSTGPGATSTLMKRSSSGGGKDQGMASRRRTKDFSTEGSHASVEGENDAKKTETKPYSPDNRRQDSGQTVDLISRKEADGDLVKNVRSMKKNNTGSSFSSSSEANGHNVSSSRLSSRNASDDDPLVFGRQTNRTLPGLIAEIMSEGKRMTYEELCNAVLPHWPHLRKHNGERYAYSSHSQAVLDCLRNRSEWARLVDRGPKTNASRKRRKIDPDSDSIDSEDNDNKRVNNGKDVGTKSFDSHQEEYPKGKRKTRKRRRLALQGRGIVGRRRRADVISNDESESFSNSSEDSMSSEEEIEQGGGAGEDSSSSSDEEVG